MANSLFDKKAKEILFKTYWSSAGWKNDPLVSNEDFVYAKARGVMFDSESPGHNSLVTSLHILAKTLDKKDISQAFLSSLSTRELAYRSALGSFAVSHWIPEHTYEKGRFKVQCSICGGYEHEQIDLNVLNFERLKWGGVRHLAISYAWFDLTEFGKLPKANPEQNDLQILSRILDAAASLDRQARAADLEKAIIGIFPSSKHERRILLEVLGYCGILQPSGMPTFFESYACYENRQQPTEHKNDWSYPVLWWRGLDGVNRTAAKYYFPEI